MPQSRSQAPPEEEVEAAFGNDLDTLERDEAQNASPGVRAGGTDQDDNRRYRGRSENPEAKPDHDHNPGDADRADKNGGGKKDAADDGDEQNKDDKGKGEKEKSRWPIFVLIAVTILAVIGGAVYWILTRNEETTDDAYTEGNAISMASKVSGYIIERRVNDNTFVHAGDLMLRIDPRDFITARDQARANLDLAQAQLYSEEINLKISRVRYPADRVQAHAQLEQARANQVNAGQEYRRQRTVDQRGTTQTAVDQARAQFQTTAAATKQLEAQLKVSALVQENIEAVFSTLKQRQAQVKQAESNLAQAELNLSYTELRAPQDGKVTRRNVDVGTFVQAGQQAFYLVPLQTWVIANFKETQLGRMRVGQHVTIAVDAFPKLKLHGRIESIQQGSGARFTTFPSENATGNFVKIVRRVPVKIVIDDGIDPQQGLPLGLSVEPTVELQ